MDGKKIETKQRCPSSLKKKNVKVGGSKNGPPVGEAGGHLPSRGPHVRSHTSRAAVWDIGRTCTMYGGETGLMYHLYLMPMRLLLHVADTQIYPIIPLSTLFRSC